MKRRDKETLCHGMSQMQRAYDGRTPLHHDGEAPLCPMPELRLLVRPRGRAQVFSSRRGQCLSRSENSRNLVTLRHLDIAFLSRSSY